MASRSQISQRLVALLQATNVLGASSSAFESSLPIESFLASKLTFPIAAVQTLDSLDDQDQSRRIDVARFVVTVCGQAVTETMPSNYLGSGGSASSQHKLENTIRDLLSGMNATSPGYFTNTAHGFQGRVAKISAEKLVTAQGKTFSVAALEIEAYDATFLDT